MASALRDNGSTRRWRRIRQLYAAQLPLPCPFCGLPVEANQPWDLDHEVPRELGGQDDKLRPAHRRCNRRGGAALTNAQRPPASSAPRQPWARAGQKPASTGDYERDVALGLESRDRDW